MALTLSSPAFGDGQLIPARYTCDGNDISPPLRWQGAPPRTRSLALVCSDPDAPSGTWYHWAIYDIPPSAHDLDEDVVKEPQVGAMRQATTDFRRVGWGGPCPPKGHGPHRYRFHLMALDVSTLGLAGTPDCRAVERAAKAHVLAEVILTGTYAR
jgi:Raf kinase inhibitor-like YbhB/YbcL family protein